ncbi:MAG: trehalase family glycosidase [Chloroflexota bacterium]
MGETMGTLLDRAAEVLDANWLGASTVPSKTLYPHQWSWDSAFIALGRSWRDQARAQLELDTLFGAQWSNGMLPHIVFNSKVRDAEYFPGPDFWDARRTGKVPRGVATSGITQPPIHARAALEMHRHARDAEGSQAFLARLYPRLVAQHDYLARDRDPTGIGLPSIVHPWESGLDNSPVWDRDLADLMFTPDAIPRYRRRDIEHAARDERPTNDAYDRFVYLAVRYRDSGYDDRHLLDSVPFAIAGPLFCAIFLWSTHALAEIAQIVGADPRPHEDAATRIHEAMLRQLWDPAAQRFYPRDVRTGHLEPEDTIVSFAPLLDPDLSSEHVSTMVEHLRSACFHPTARDHFIVPSYSTAGVGFDRRRYWRGPVWINTNWLLWHGLQQHGRVEEAAEIARSSLALVARSGFREYFDPFDGTGYGADGFGWSAALTIDLVERLGGPDRVPLDSATSPH